MQTDGRHFNPTLLSRAAMDAIIAVIAEGACDDHYHVSELLRRIAASAETYGFGETGKEGLELAVAASLLADLKEQGWELSVGGGRIYMHVPQSGAGKGESFSGAKARLRHGLLIGSDRQLATPPVQEFIRLMERERVVNGQIHSIKSLIDDGNELLDRITAHQNSRGAGITGLERLIKPVLQVCESDAFCKFTGLRLQDIWRYFRHTWSLEYNPSPGRTLRFLVRNKARRNWPVMGIAMLASPAANLYVRDRWIGWTLDELMTRVVDRRWDAAIIGKELLRTVDAVIANIRTDDLLTREELKNPSQATIFRLQQVAARAEALRRRDLENRAIGKHENIVDIRCFEKQKLSEESWWQLSGTALFLRKRAAQLVPLLQALRFFRAHGLHLAPAAALCEILVTRRGRDIVNFVLSEIRKQRLATEVADLSICGAIPPYNHLLGGKLVALAMMSQEACNAYVRRYAKQPSEIASQLAGRSVLRSSQLKVITTTSLYGIGSSQYNRLRLKAAVDPGLSNDLEWIELDKTEGFTVTHLSKRTVEYMRLLGTAVHGRRRINSVFGEGSSPRVRQVREGLNLIGINNDDVLKQGLQRRVYACELFPDARESLIGFRKDGTKKKLPTLRTISSAWLKRWVVARLCSPEVQEQMRYSNGNRIIEDLRVRAERARSEDAAACGFLGDAQFGADSNLRDVLGA